MHGNAVLVGHESDNAGFRGYFLASRFRAALRSSEMEHGMDERRVSVRLAVGRELLSDGTLGDPEPVRGLFDAALIDIGAEDRVTALGGVVLLAGTHATLR
jgi:hypothetical protein